MKSGSLVVLVCLVLAIVHGEETISSIAQNLSRSLMIEQKAVEKCLNKTEVTPDDFLALDDAMTSNLEDLNTESFRRASCAMTCCGQLKGMMIGAKIQIPVIHKMIRESSMPTKLQHAFHMNVDTCYVQVKHIVDECDIGYHFTKCVISKTWEMERI